MSRAHDPDIFPVSRDATQAPSNLPAASMAVVTSRTIAVRDQIVETEHDGGEPSR
jgi:hypothetical protein